MQLVAKCLLYQGMTQKTPWLSHQGKGFGAPPAPLHRRSRVRTTTSQRPGLDADTPPPLPDVRQHRHDGAAEPQTYAPSAAASGLEGGMFMSPSRTARSRRTARALAVGSADGRPREQICLSKPLVAKRSGSSRFQFRQQRLEWTPSTTR